MQTLSDSQRLLSKHTQILFWTGTTGCKLEKLEEPKIDFDRPRASGPPVLGALTITLTTMPTYRYMLYTNKLSNKYYTIDTIIKQTNHHCQPSSPVLLHRHWQTLLNLTSLCNVNSTYGLSTSKLTMLSSKIIAFFKIQNLTVIQTYVKYCMKLQTIFNFR